jgi:dipeptidase E
MHPTNPDDHRQLLLISNSTVHGCGYLDHVDHDIRALLGRANQILFIPFALQDRAAYTAKARAWFHQRNVALTSVHDVSNVPRAVGKAEAVFIGGGNTFRLLRGLYDYGLLEPIRRRVADGIPFIGSSAGSIVACPSLRTTKDMPVVQPPSFDALGLVRFQISPHYLDPDPSSTHMGETQEERILQFLEENDAPVIGLREGSSLRVQRGAITLRGPYSARIFRRDHPPIETPSESDCRSLLEASPTLAGEAA